MGIRADITPQVARIDAHLLKRNVPTRLCYLGSVLHSRTNSSGDSRSPLQLGAELFGHEGVSSDIEIVKLMLATLDAVRISNICLDVGHIGIFRSLISKSQLNSMQESEVFEIVKRKAKDELKIFYKKLKINDDSSKAMLDLIDLHGDVGILDDAIHAFDKLSPDIRKYVNFKLNNCGVEEVENIDFDTFEDKDNFYSYRRSQKLGQTDYGRCIATISLKT